MVSQLELENQELSQELAQERRKLREGALKADSSTQCDNEDDNTPGVPITTATVEIEQAHKQIKLLTLERDKLRRDIQCSALDLKQYSTLLVELDETKAQLERTSLFEEEMVHAMNTIDKQASELARLKLELASWTEESHPMIAAGTDNFTSELLGVAKDQPCLSLEEELAQATADDSLQTSLAEVK